MEAHEVIFCSQFWLAPDYYRTTVPSLCGRETEQWAGLEVICPGLPRTGTTSLASALATLLGGRTYHGWHTLFGPQEDVEFWLRVGEGRAADSEESLSPVSPMFITLE